MKVTMRVNGAERSGDVEPRVLLVDGAGAGIAASAILAVLLKTILAHVPASQDAIEGVTMLIAVVVLTMRRKRNDTVSIYDRELSTPTVTKTTTVRTTTGSVPVLPRS